MMTRSDPKERPVFRELVKHSMFWEEAKSLEFLTTVKYIVRSKYQAANKDVARSLIGKNFEEGKKYVLPKN